MTYSERELEFTFAKNVPKVATYAVAARTGIEQATFLLSVPSKVNVNVLAVTEGVTTYG